MEIIFSEDTMPKEHVVKHFEEAAVFCATNEGLDSEKISVSVTFVGMEEIRELNREHRGKDATTDVLSFPMYEPEELEELKGLNEEEEICLGDVVICSEQALIQSDEFGHSFERELVYLFVHSMYHLLGYDHMEENEKVVMRSKEEAAMQKVGLVR